MKDLANGHETTFAEHLDSIGRLCGAFAGLGVAPTDRVGALASNSHAYIGLGHACLAGAGIINPLNTRLAADEIAYIMNDSGTKVIFVDASFAAAIDEIRHHLDGLAVEATARAGLPQSRRSTRFASISGRAAWRIAVSTMHAPAGVTGHWFEHRSASVFCARVE